VGTTTASSTPQASSGAAAATTAATSAAAPAVAPTAPTGADAASGTPRASPSPSAALSGTATPTDPLEAELALALANPPPKRDLLDLARRFKVKPGTPTVVPTPAPPQAVGDSRDFWVADSARKRYFKVRAKLAQRSDHVDFYVQDGETTDNAAITRSLQTIETTIIPGIAHYFGGSALPLDKLRIAILNTRLTGLIGYYSSVDEFPSWVAPFSNERPLIAMSLSAVQPGSRGYDSGLAHELEHLIQWRLDPSEDTWINEGTAELAIRALGLDPSANYQSFLQRPDTQLNDWAEQVSDTPRHYGASDLFFTYLSQRFGGYGIVGEILARPERGIVGIERALDAHGAPSLAPLFVDFSIANWANQPNAEDSRYGYRDLRQVRARDEPLALPTRVATTVHQFATRYYALPPNSAGKTIAVDVARDVRLVAAPDRGRPVWWSNRSDSADSRLTREIDLRGATAATLRFSVWHDLEKDFDYGYVTASTDGGATWTTLPSKTGSTGDPTGANYGVGFTGKSGGSLDWIDEQIDLSTYAGQRVLLRFEVVTDDAYNGGGLCLDAIEIPEIGWRDAAGDAGWRAEGFVRIANRVPQRVAATLIASGPGQVRTFPIAIAPDGRGRLVVPPEVTGLERLAIAISGLTPITNVPVDVAIGLEAA
jgi:hypothetical protein